MIIQDFLPDAAAKEFVQCYRVVHFEFDPAAVVPNKFYAPKPEQCLHFFLHDLLSTKINGGAIIDHPPIIFSGQSTSLVQRFMGHHILNVQIVFQPMAVYRLTGIPAHELTNQYLDGTAIFRNGIKNVYEQLQAAGNYIEMVGIISRFAKQLIASCRKTAVPLDAIGRYLLQSEGNLGMDQLATASCLCPRQFRRSFQERVGVNPKTYARIVQFNKAFNYKNRFPSHDWTRVAAACNYADYQHLVKAYKEFTALTPPAMHAIEHGSPESVLGLTKNLYHSRFRPGV